MTQDKPQAFRDALILPVEGEPIPAPSLMIVHKGKIIFIGKPPSAPPMEMEADVHECSGQVLIPGLVDTHSHIGISSRPNVSGNNDGNEMSGPIQPGLRAIDAIFPGDPGIRMAVAGGVTTANIMPGSGNAIGGQTLYVKLRGESIEVMRITDGGVLGGLKMANGENPKGYGRRTPAQAPITRMKVAALQREQFQKAREYQKQWQTYRKKKADGKEAVAPDTDLAMEPLLEVLEKKRTVHFHCHRADDLLTALRIAQEFQFEIVLQHATEGYRVAGELASKKIPVSLTLVDSPGGKLETAALIEENAAILDKAGVKVAINTDDSVTESRFYLRTGAIAVRGGMSEAAALRALTLHPAQMMHLEARIGSLKTGKDADFVLLSGSPFSNYTHVLETWIDGIRRFDRDKDWPFQTGGFAIADRVKVPKPLLAAPNLPAAAKTKTPTESSSSESDPLVILAGRAHTISRGVERDVAVVIRNGKIEQFGSRANVKLPVKARYLTASDITPGLIDAHAVVPLTGLLNIPADQEQDEASDPNQADLRVLDAFHPEEPLLQFLREQGVTVVHATPGRSNVIAGQTGIFRTSGNTAERMALRAPAAILMNLGEIPKLTYPGKGPSTRMASAALVRNSLVAAQNQMRKKASNKDPEKPIPINPKLDALELVLERKIPVVLSAHRADDIRTALRLADEFKFRLILDLATEGFLLADELATAKIPIIVHPTMQRAASSMETLNSFTANAGVLNRKGIPVAIGTAFEGYVPKTRVLRFEAAAAAAAGLGHAAALRAVTLHPARILGIDKDYGTLDVGKVADIILYDGDPLETTTHILNTVMAGKVVFDRAAYLKLPFERRALPLILGGGGCCLGIW